MQLASFRCPGIWKRQVSSLLASCLLLASLAWPLAPTFDESLVGYVLSGCAPTVPASSLTFAAFACRAIVKMPDGTARGIEAPAAAVGALSGGDGTYWLALQAERSTAASPWTVQPGTYFLWQKSATQPTAPSKGLIFARATVASSVIQTVTPVNSLRGTSDPRTVLDITDYGARGDNATDNTAAVQRAHDALPSTGGTLYVPQGTYVFASALAFTKPTTIASTGRDSTIWKTSFINAALLVTTSSLRVKGVTMQRTDTAVGTSYAAIRLDYAAANHTNLILDDMTITGFDIGVYANGYDVTSLIPYTDNIAITNSYIQTNTLNTGGVTPTLNVGRANLITITGNTLITSDPAVPNQHNNIYIIVGTQIRIVGNRIINGICSKLLSGANTGTINEILVDSNYFSGCNISVYIGAEAFPVQKTKKTADGGKLPGGRTRLIIFSFDLGKISAQRQIVDFFNRNIF